VGEGQCTSIFHTYLPRTRSSIWLPTEIEAAFNVGMVINGRDSYNLIPTPYLLPRHDTISRMDGETTNDIAAVCGDRMPVLSDMPDLPIMRAIVKEGLRWRPAVPTGL